MVATGIILTILGLISAIYAGAAAGFLVLAGQLLYLLGGSESAVTPGLVIEGVFLAALWSVMVHFTVLHRPRDEQPSYESFICALAGGICGAILLGPAGLLVGSAVGALVGDISGGELLTRVGQVGWRKYLTSWVWAFVRIGALSLLLVRLVTV